MGCAEPIYYFVTSGQTGKQTQIDINHSSSWDFAVINDFLFGGGVLTMKDGPSTTAEVTLAVWEGGNRLAYVTLDNTPFSHSYASVHSDLPAAVWLLARRSYSIRLTSIAPDRQNSAYFIKATSYGFFDANGNPLSPDPFNPPVGTPEAPAWSLVAGGAAFLGAGSLRCLRRGK